MKTNMAMTSLEAYDYLVRTGKAAQQVGKVLNFILKHPNGVTQWEITRQLGMLRSSVTRPCKELEDKGWIEVRGVRLDPMTKVNGKVYYPREHRDPVQEELL